MTPEMAPFPVSITEAARWAHTRKRRRLLGSTWGDDLRETIVSIVDPTRARSWGPEDTTKNNFRSVVHQMATLYDAPGSFSNEDPASAARVSDVLDKAGWWQLGISHHRSVVGLRESLVRLRVTAAGDVQIRLVTPDLVAATATMDDPDEPFEVREWRPRWVREHERAKPVKRWTQDVVSIEDPDRPMFRVLDETGQKDLSGQFLGAPLEGETYPAEWRHADGSPFLPFVLTHAERTGKLWDAFEGSELVHGSLVIAALWTFWNHCVFDASWPQRNAANGMPGGQLQRDELDERLGYVPTDPASIIAWVSTRPGTPVTFHQFAAGADPEKLGRAIRDYSSHLAIDYGISASDIDRTHGNAQSGYAVMLSRDGVRTQRRRFKPGAARADAELAWKTAAMVNRTTGAGLAEEGYTARYAQLGKSIAEVRDELEVLRAEVDLGLASRVDVYRARHGVTRDEAIARLDEIRADNARFPTT